MSSTFDNAGPPGVDATSTDTLIGNILADRYRIVRRIGEGGMGVVYEAEHIVIERRLAVKILADEYAKKGDLVQRFMQEAKAASRIGHENIVDVTDFGKTSWGTVFIVMEYLDGCDLSHVIRQDGAMAWSRAKPILSQVCRALAAAHVKGIIHRDLKPENIYLVEREGRQDFVKVLDFGIAKMSATEATGESARLTKTGMIFGTPEYMSPEQASGAKPDQRVDIYALGVIMYEMLTGAVPFHADTFMGILTKHMFELPMPPSQVRPDLRIPADVETIVLRALQKDRDKRFQSMADFDAAVAACSGTGRLSIPPPHPLTRAPIARTPPIRSPTVLEGEVSAPKRGRAMAYAGGAAAALALVVVAAYFALGGGGAANSGGAPAPVAASAPAPAQTQISPSPVVPVAQETPQVQPSDASPSPDKRRPRGAAKEPPTVEITVQTRPPGADVLRNDQLQGVTPLTLKLPSGSAAVPLTLRKKGFRDEVLDVIPDKSREYERLLARMQLGRLGRRPDAAATLPAPAPVTPQPEPAPPPKKEESPTKLRDLKNPFGD